jgi:hypothetical protein
MAVQEAQLKQLVKQFDYYDSDLHVNSALIGSDFLATTIRAWPQFFFAYVLPFPLIQAASFAIAGVLWTMRAREYRASTVLTDEFILSYLALKDEEKTPNEAEKEKQRAIEAELFKLNQAHLENLKAFLAVKGKKQKILDALQTPLESEKPLSQDQWSSRWAYGFNIAFQYATAHWVLWMTGTLLFYSKDRWEFDNWHGVNDDYHQEYDNNPGNIPSVFENDTYASLQFILPALIIIGAQAYKWYYKDEQAKQEKFTRQQQQVRAEYLAYLDELEAQKERGHNAETAPLLDKKDVKDSNFFNTERWATILSMGTAFWSAFLVGNLLAWPVTGLLNRILAEKKYDDDYQMDDEIKIITTFSVIMMGCFAHMYFKYVDMQKEARDAGYTNLTAQTVHDPTQSIWSYYSQHPRTAINIVLDRMSGSGGILAMRFIFMGGIGGYAVNNNDSDGMDHIKEVMPIALTAMALMIVLNLYQTYYAAQRENSLKKNHDHELKPAKQRVTF